MNTWTDLEMYLPDVVDVDVKLKDGSIIIGCWAQSDGDFYWRGGGTEMYILEHTVAQWRASEAHRASKAEH